MHEKSWGAGRFVQMRFFARTDPLGCEHTHFETYFLVILPFDPALGEGGTLSYIDYIVMSSLKVYEVFFKDILFRIILSILAIFGSN